MPKKIISASLIIIISMVFFVLPLNGAQALNTGGYTMPSVPPPNPSIGPDYSQFGSSISNNLLGTAVSAAACFAGMALGFFSGGSDYWYCIDNFVVRPIMRTIENSIENAMLNQISAVVTDKLGQGKDPHFITDWRNSTLNSQARGNDVFRSILADTPLCKYFDDNLKNVFGADQYGGVLSQVGIQNLTNPPGTENFQYNNRCTMNFDIADLEQNFSSEKWLTLIQPNNNVFGVYANALQEQQAQTIVDQDSARQENLANDGFVGSKENPFAGVTGGASGIPSASGCSIGSLTRCIFKGKNITPGKMFGDATAKVFDQKFETIGGAQEIQDLILALADSVINKLSGRLFNLLGSGTGTVPNTTNNIAHLTCLANCQAASYPQCTASITPLDQQLTCIQNAIVVCQSQCP